MIMRTFPHRQARNILLLLSSNNKKNEMERKSTAYAPLVIRSFVLFHCLLHITIASGRTERVLMR